MKLFRRIFKLLIISFLIIGSCIFIFFSYFAKDIKTSVLNKIQQKLESPLFFDNVEFTLFKTFPNASIKITNLLVFESKEFNNDTLLFTKHAYAEVSLINVINKNYDINNLTFTNANIKIQYNKQNLPNFMIFKQNSKGGNLLSVSKITLINTNLNIKKENPILNLNWYLTKGVISITNHKYTFSTKGFSKNLSVGLVDYMKDKQFNIITKTEITKDKIAILKSNMNIDDVLLNVTGGIKKGNILNLKINGKNQEITKIVAVLPENIKKICAPLILTGNISFKSSLNGLTNKNNNPLFEMDYKIINGNLKLNSNTFEMSDIQMNGSLSNGKNRNFKSTKIESKSFRAKIKNGEINGNFILQNLNNYFLTSEFKSSWDLTEVNKYFKNSRFNLIEGNLVAHTNYQGNIAFDTRFKNRFLNANHYSDIKIENLKFKNKNSPQLIIKSADCRVENNKILVNSLQSSILQSNFNFKGEILNLMPYMLNQNTKVYIKGHTKSTYTNLYDIISIRDIFKDEKEKTRETKNILPNWINTNSTIYIKNFLYNNFTASNFTGAIEYNNNILYGKNLNAISLDGKLSGKFRLIEPTNKNLKLTSTLKLEKINIRDSFKAFNNYNQSVITKKQIKGVGTAYLNIESHWKPNFVLDTKKLKVKSHLIIEKGELIDFEPLEKLSTYVSLDELKHVRFSTLENTIYVENEIVTIPAMEIKSSALSVVLSGTHSFNHEIDYNLTLLLSELLSSSFRQKNTNITEFGEEQKDGRIFNTIYFKMKGNTANPKISLNPIRFIEDVNNSVKKETEKIINIIKEDILQSETKERVEEGQEIEIQWEP